MKRGDWSVWLVLGFLALMAGAGTGIEYMNLSDLEKRVQLLSDAIETAEGYHEPGSRPNRNNNPGDLELDITQTAIGQDGPFMVYATYADGRAALEHLVRLMLTDTSHIYNSSMTIDQVASHYTATEQDAWAANVAAFLGVTPGTSIGDIPV